MGYTVVITPAQSRAARALLDLHTEQVAEKAGIGINTVQRFERKDQAMNLATIEKLVAAYQDWGVEFPDNRTVRMSEEAAQAVAQQPARRRKTRQDTQQAA